MQKHDSEIPDLDNLIVQNDQIVTESVDLEEIISSEDNLEIGSCNASVFKLTVADVGEDLTGQQFIATMWVGEDLIPIELGTFNVVTCIKQANLRFKDITAYDNVSKLDVDVSDWWNSLTFDYDLTVKAFRQGLCVFCGMEYVEQTLVNDSVLVEKTIFTSSVTGRELMKACMQINGTFGKCNRSGQFEAITLGATSQEQYTAADYSSEDLPKHEEYSVKPIDKVQIKSEEDDIGGIYGTGTNAFILEANFICYGKTAEQLNQIAENLYSVVSEITYTPIEGNFVGLPYLETGDCITFQGKISYVLSRHLTGIQALKDAITSNGLETRSNLEDVNSSLERVKALLHIFRNTVEELTSIITDEESGLQSEISQLVDQIDLKVEMQDIENYIYGSARVGIGKVGNCKIGDCYDSKVSSEFQVAAEQISSMVKKGDLISTINQSAEKISMEAVDIDLEGCVTFSNLSGDGETVINAGNITTGILSAVGINIGGAFTVDADSGFVTAKSGHYGGWAIGDYVITSIPDVVAEDPMAYLARRNGIQAYGNGSYAISIGYSSNSRSWSDGYFTVTHSGDVKCNSLVCGGSSFNGHSHATGSTIDASLYGTSNGRGDYIYFSNGGQGATTGWCAATFQYKSSSDMRLKYDIQTPLGILNMYQGLKPKQYRFKDTKENDKVHYGLLAQQVINLLSENGIDYQDTNLIEIVENAPGRDDGMYCSGGTHYRINYEELHAWHILAIQELVDRISELEEKVI